MPHARIALFITTLMTPFSANAFAADRLFSGTVLHQDMAPSETPDECGASKNDVS